MLGGDPGHPEEICDLGQLPQTPGKLKLPQTPIQLQLHVNACGKAKRAGIWTGRVAIMVIPQQTGVWRIP